MGTRIRSHNSAIVYVDPKGHPHAAIVTAWWGGPAETGTYGGHPADPDHEATVECACNLVFVSGDGDKHDPYGRQLERATSVVHKSLQSAHGNYWRWPDEE